MTRRLVITADDVGADRASIDAVVGLVGAGRVSAASVIPMAPWAADAVQVLATGCRTGAISLGLHATFTADPNGAGWGPLSGGPSLVAPHTARFPADVMTFAELARPAEVQEELRAQVAWFGPHGVRPSHLDSHDGAIFGVDGSHFIDAAVAICAEHDLVLRLPRTVPAELGLLPARVREMHRDSVALADDFGVRIPETVGTEWRPLSQLSGYEDLRAAYLALLRGLPEGLSEIFLHPAVDPRPAAAMTDGMVKRVWEHRLLQDDAFGDALAEEGIVVVPWPAPASAPTTAPTSA